MINKNILTTEVQTFIKDNESCDFVKLLFQKPIFQGISQRELVQQIQGLSKSKVKLPLWHATSGVYFPPSVNIQQCSSSLTALHKSGRLFGVVIDGTGGFGVDSLYFSKSCQRVIYVEQNKELFDIACHNFDVFQASNIERVCDSVEHFLKTLTNGVDFIYLDPSRRDSHNGRVFLIEDCTPDVLELFPVLFSKTDRVVLKLSPMLDIDSLLRLLHWVRCVEVVSVCGEVKELVLFLEKGYLGEVTIRSVNLEKGLTREFEFTKGDIPCARYGQIQKYVYLPMSCVSKAGAIDPLAESLGLEKLSKFSNILTSSFLVDNFFGRSFVVHGVFSYNKSFKKNYYKGNFSIVCCDFPLKAESLRAELKAGEDPHHYLIFTTDSLGNKVVIDCQRIDIE